MTMRTVLSILFRLCMTALFFVGLVWVIRIESLWKVMTGLALMLITVPLSYEIGAAIAGHHRISFKSLQSMSKAVFPVVGPVVLLFVFMSTLEYYSRTGDAKMLMLNILLTPPLVRVLIDAMAGEIPWQAGAISDAYSHGLLQMMSRLIYVAGGLLLLGFLVIAVVSLFVSLGDLIRQGLFSSEPFSTPVLCKFPVFEAEPCLPDLLTWHGISLIALVVVWRYGHQLLHKVDALFMRR